MEQENWCLFKEDMEHSSTISLCKIACIYCVRVFEFIEFIDRHELKIIMSINKMADFVTERNCKSLVKQTIYIIG